MLVYEAIVKGLEGIGVRAAFGGPGENAAGMMLALKDSEKIQPIMTMNEQAASFMAGGYAMFTDRLGVCFATAGPGAFNLVSGICMALTDSYPVLAITGYSSIEWTGKGSLNETSGVGRTPDSRALFDSICKKSYILDDINKTSDVLEEAVNVAFEGRPGPVHIAVAEDLTDTKVKVTNYHEIRLNVEPVEPDPAQVKEIAEVLADAVRHNKRVVVLAGFGAVRAKAGDELRELVERFQFPLVTTMDGKGIIDEEHPLAIGLFCDTGHKGAWDLFLDADIVLAVGNAFGQHATFDFRDDLLENKTLIHINIDPDELDKVYKADHPLHADARLALAAINEEMQGDLAPTPSKDFDPKDYDTQKIYKLLRKLHPGQLTQTISQKLPDNAIILGDAGAHVAWLGYYLELSKGQHFRKPGTYGPMAGHTNGALGVQVAFPERTVVVGCGDGCYLMSGFELLTAVEYDLPVIWVIFNDGEYKLIKLHQLAAFQRTGLVEFTNPDYVKYAESCGATGYRVETIEEFEEAFDKALAARKPALIDAHITRLALPNYSPSPEGILAAVWEAVQKRFGNG